MGERILHADIGSIEDGSENSRNPRKKCSVDGCDTVHSGHGYCQAHLIRFKKYGDANAYSPDRMSNQKWIDAHKNYEDDDCIVWPFHRGGNGRGVVGAPPNRMSAPKAMCIAAHGLPPGENMQAAHNCGNGHLGCMNPKHLRWATHADNVLDRADHGRDRIGTQINTNKLSEEQVREIRGRKGLDTGVSLAKEFGVTPSTISSIYTGKNWRWLT